MSNYNEPNDLILVRFLKFIKKTINFAIIGFIIAGSLAILLILYLQSLPLLNTTTEQTTFIYSMDGTVLDDLHSVENRVYVPLSKIPQSLIDATIAIEDRKFYSHFGFDLFRIGGALIEDIKHNSKVQGASTITQQLAKNLYLSLDKTWERKFKEILLAIQLELQYSKKEILELYLNEIYFGYSTNGVQMAAKTYFDKDVSELSLAESSMLAGIPKGPAYYSPFSNMDNAKARQKLVLTAMVNENYITKEEADIAYETNLVFKNSNIKNYPTQAPYFRDYVITILKTQHGFTDEDIYTGGLKVYTTLDSKIQSSAEETISKYLFDKNELQVALISIEPSTGYIKAMVGGRDYTESQYNRVFAYRQPGSSFKPILYLAALENGFTPVSKFISEPTVFTFSNNKTYEPSNYGDSYPYKEIDLRYALTHSDNIYAVKTHLEIGMDKLVDMSKKLGINAVLEAYPSLALGSQEVSPFDMTKAYGVIANNGKAIQPIAILKILDKNGNTIYENKETVETQVILDTTAFTMTYLMEGVFEAGGTGFNVSDLIKRPVAGKTGTTDYDSWLIGYTPLLVTTLWTGYDQNQLLVGDDAYLAKTIWAEYMEKAHEGIAPQLFKVPDGIISMYVCSETGDIATTACPNPRLEAFVEGTEPTEYCKIHSNIDQNPIPLDGETTNSSSLWNKFKYWWNN
ncbi:MAG: transglycosylase domain-containing protein [Vulcanibacillus sp.]